MKNFQKELNDLEVMNKFQNQMLNQEEEDEDYEQDFDEEDENYYYYKK